MFVFAGRAGEKRRIVTALWTRGEAGKCVLLGDFRLTSYGSSTTLEPAEQIKYYNGSEKRTSSLKKPKTFSTQAIGKRF